MVFRGNSLLFVICQTKITKLASKIILKLKIVSKINPFKVKLSLLSLNYLQRRSQAAKVFPNRFVLNIRESAALETLKQSLFNN